MEQASIATAPRSKTSVTRVLHVVEGFAEQATEAWLAALYEEVVRRGLPLHWTFYCVEPITGPRVARLEQLGARLIHSPHRLSQTGAFIRALRSELKAGAYDVIHAHHDVLSAVYLWASRGLPVRRVVHVHNAWQRLPMHPVKDALVNNMMREYCLRRADRVVGVSADALATFLRGRSPAASRDMVLHCGIPVEEFAFDPRRAAATRDRLGVPRDAFTVLFAGRMTDYKNPQFVVDVISELKRLGQPVAGLFAGRGPLEESVARYAADAGLAKCVQVLGWRSDIGDLMSASDVLLWPSVENPKEGLGLGVVEAQAAGLPVVASASVPDEAIVADDLVRIVPLKMGSASWAHAAVALQSARQNSRAAYNGVVASSSFSLSHCLDVVATLYDSSSFVAHPPASIGR